LDIFAEFEIEYLASKGTGKKENVGCGNGAFDRSSLGPFGILAIADDKLSELTPIYFHLSNTSFFCVDETRYYTLFICLLSLKKTISLPIVSFIYYEMLLDNVDLQRLLMFQNSFLEAKYQWSAMKDYR